MGYTVVKVEPPENVWKAVGLHWRFRILELLAANGVMAFVDLRVALRPDNVKDPMLADSGLHSHLRYLRKTGLVKRYKSIREQKCYKINKKKVEEMIKALQELIT